MSAQLEITFTVESHYSAVLQQQGLNQIIGAVYCGSIAEDLHINVEVGLPSGAAVYGSGLWHCIAVLRCHYSLGFDPRLCPGVP